MTVRRRVTPRRKIDWGAASFVLAITLAILAGIQAYFTFNSTISVDVAVLKQQVHDLREAERERRQERE